MWLCKKRRKKLIRPPIKNQQGRSQIKPEHFTSWFLVSIAEYLLKIQHIDQQLWIWFASTLKEATKQENKANFLLLKL